METGIFLSVKDLMILNGTSNYSSVARQHKIIRESMKTGKRKLTIKEYCNYEGLEFEYIWGVLRK
jgi:hypothetical protein